MQEKETRKNPARDGHRRRGAVYTHTRAGHSRVPKGADERKEKRLVEQQDALQQMIENGLEDYEYRQSLEYIEKYAREELGMIDAGDTIWKQAD